MTNIDQTYPGGFIVKTEEFRIVIEHPYGKCHMMSSSRNGGYYDDIRYLQISNNDFSEDSYLIIKSCSNVQNMSISTMSFGLTNVTALSVSGLKKNDYIFENGYTTSVIIMINTDLPQSTMARAIITATEGIVCALQQIMIYDPMSKYPYSDGSLCVIVLCDGDCERILNNAGKHSKLGELIGKTVIEATLSSLNMNGICPEYQTNIIRRLERFGITMDSFKQILEKMNIEPITNFDSKLKEILSDTSTIAYVSAIVQIYDSILWGLIPVDDGYNMGYRIICNTLYDVTIHSNNLIDDLVSSIALKANTG